MSDNRHATNNRSRFLGSLLALRWKRDNSLIIYLVAAVFIVMIIVLFTCLHLLSAKQVTLVVDGEVMNVSTNQVLIEQLLEEQGVVISDHDRISVPLGEKVADHQRIEVKHAVPVAIAADNRVIELLTPADTIAQALQEAGITIGALDRIDPGLNYRVSEGEHIQVVRVKKSIDTETDLIPYEIITQNDANLIKGKEKVVQEGLPGLKENTIERLYEDGKLIAENVLASAVQRESVDKIVAVGTKSPVTILSASSPNVDTLTRDDVTFHVKRKLDNVVLTAYEAGLESTGKSADHPNYGITYTGTTVKEGRTVAVDPKVIPFGWWIYIEGYGFRRAEDKGSGVKGNWIDIYYESLDTVNNFGLKRNQTVYIIGPDNPLVK